MIDCEYDNTVTKYQLYKNILLATHYSPYNNDRCKKDMLF